MEGRHEMIDFYPAASESGACWESFLNDLYRRGLKASPCELIATDGGTGLHQALQIVYPKILIQRCWAHKTRNVLDKVKKIDQPAVKKALTRISHASNRREATKAYWRLSARWRKAYPRAVACLKKDFDQLLSFFQIKNSQLYSRLRTTNLIERAFQFGRYCRRLDPLCQEGKPRIPTNSTVMIKSPSPEEQACIKACRDWYSFLTAGSAADGRQRANSLGIRTLKYTCPRLD